MFSIITNPAIQDCSRLEKQVSDLRLQRVELEQIIKELSGLSGLQEAAARLARQHSEMEFQHTVLRQMQQALNQVTFSYIKCENEICDNGGKNDY